MKTTRIIAVVLLLASGPSDVPAQPVPPLLNYQGQIQNPDGSALPTADYELSFSIYDSPQAGNLIWGPQVFDGRSGPGYGPRIPVVQGYFNVSLGPLDTASRSLSVAFGGMTRYVEIAVGNRAPVAPRQQMLSAPFTFNAAQADQARLALNANNADQAAFATLAQKAITATNALNLGGVGAGDVFLGLAPVGAILSYYRNASTLPANWRLCDGSVVSDPASPFHLQQLPDLREMFARGAGGGFILGAVGGSDSIGSHSHSFVASDPDVFIPRRSISSWIATWAPVTAAQGLEFDSTKWIVTMDKDANLRDSHGHTGGSSFASGNTGSAGSHDNKPRFLSVHFIIRIK